MSDLMIRVENLTKDYGPFRAVDKVTFNVRKGEVLGFLGANGAGTGLGFGIFRPPRSSWAARNRSVASAIAAAA